MLLLIKAFEGSKYERGVSYQCRRVSLSTYVMIRFATSKEEVDSHLVYTRARGLPGRVLGVKIVVDLDVQITLVFFVGLVVQVSLDALSLLDCQHFPQIEDRLFPMRVFGVRAGGESDGLVAGAKLDVEPGYQGVDEVVSADLELEWRAKGDIGHLNCVKIERHDGYRIRNNSLHLDRID